MQDLPLPTADATYIVRFEGRVEGAGSGKVSLAFRKRERDYEILGYKVFDGPEFKRHSFAVRVPSSGGEALEVWLGQQDYKNTKCTIYYDNVSVQTGE